MNPTNWSTDTWTAIGSAATALAFLVSAWVLWLHVSDRRRRDAEGVAVWVNDQYEQREDGGLDRLATVHLKNVGNRAVLDAQVVLGHGLLGTKPTRIGAVAVPMQPVLAPGAELSWPVSEFLRSVEVQGRLLAEVSFRDTANRWWLREFGGRVRRWRSRMRSSVRKMKDTEVSLDSLGPRSFENPISVAAAFWSLLGDEDSPDRLAKLQGLCTPETLDAWGDFSEVRTALVGHGLASFPLYPAPGIAHVKFPENVESAFVVTGPKLMAVKIMTLQYREDLDPPGWRVFGLGAPVSPERVPPPGASRS